MSILPRPTALVDGLRLGAIGLGAAWRTPAVIDRELPTLLVAPVGGLSAPSVVVTGSTTSARSMNSIESAAFASRVAFAVLVRLARVVPGRWRATCLYRSVAECLVLRQLGLPARVVIGVGPGDSVRTAGRASPAGGVSAARDEVIAHAWVECEGVECMASRGAAELEALSVRRLGARGEPARTR